MLPSTSHSDLSSAPLPLLPLSELSLLGKPCLLTPLCRPCQNIEMTIHQFCIIHSVASLLLLLATTAEAQAAGSIPPGDSSSANTALAPESAPIDPALSSPPIQSENQASSVDPGSKQPDPQVVASSKGEGEATSALVDYTVNPGDLASTILYRFGVGTSGSPYRIYGDDGYLRRLKAANPNFDIDQLEAGTTLKIPVPQALLKAAPNTGGGTPVVSTTQVPKSETVVIAAQKAKIQASTAPLSVPTERPKGEFVCGFKASEALVFPKQGASFGVVRETYVVQPGDTISAILFARGIGRPDEFARIFGEHGWLLPNQELNFAKDLERLIEGDSINLVYPVASKQDPCNPDAVKQQQLAEEQARRAAREKEAQKQAALVLAAPEKASLKQLVSLKEEDRKKVDKQEIVKKLDDAAVADLDEQTAAAIPEEVVEEKATEVSIFDRDKPGMDKLFKNMKLKTPAAYLGARAGFSLAAREEKLLSQVVAYSLLAEVRDGPAQGLRVMYETVPKITANSDGYKQSLEYNRFLLGWAFEFPAPFLFDLMHMTPRLGRYQIEARTPGGTRSNGTKYSNNLTVPSALGAGIEVDAEWAKYFYVVRFWGSRDIVLPMIRGKFESITTRAGVDLYLKGGSFTLWDTKFSPNYLLFTAYEGILLRGGAAEAKGQSVALDLPTLGLGMTLTTN